MQELIHAIRCDLLSLQAERAEQVQEARYYAYWLFRMFSWHISQTQSFQENRRYISGSEAAGIANRRPRGL